jgi:hypothetical protein
MSKTKSKAEGQYDSKKKDSIERYNHLHQAVGVFVSESDLKNPVYQNVLKAGIVSGEISENPTIEEILFKVWGINTPLGFDSEKLTHKTRFNSVHTGIRYSGYERCDDEWYKNRMCSDEMKNRIESWNARKYHERW